MDTYRVLVLLENRSQPILYDATSVYTKDGYTCIIFYRDGKKLTHKYPTSRIMRIEEEYRYIEHGSSRASIIAQPGG